MAGDKERAARAKLPGLHKKLKATGKLSAKGGLRTTLTTAELRSACGGDKYPICLDLSPAHFRLTSQDVLARIPPNALKELDVTDNELAELNVLHGQARLRRLVADRNCLTSVAFVGLEGLQHLSLAHNALRRLPAMLDLQKLVYLCLRGNRLEAGLEHLAQAKALRVLDLSKNDLDLSLQALLHDVLLPLKELPRLAHLCLEENPLARRLVCYRAFVVHQLPQLEVLDGVRVSKEERVAAARADAAGEFAAKDSPRERPRAAPQASVSSTQTPAAATAVEEPLLAPTSAEEALLEELLAGSGGAADSGQDMFSELDALLAEDGCSSVQPPAALATQAPLPPDKLNDLLSALDADPQQQQRQPAAVPPSPAGGMGEAHAESVSNAPQLMDEQQDYSSLLDDLARELDFSAGSEGYSPLATPRTASQQAEMQALLDNLEGLSTSAPVMEKEEDVFGLLDELMAGVDAEEVPQEQDRKPLCGPQRQTQDLMRQQKMATLRGDRKKKPKPKLGEERRGSNNVSDADLEEMMAALIAADGGSNEYDGECMDDDDSYDDILDGELDDDDDFEAALAAALEIEGEMPDLEDVEPMHQRTLPTEPSVDQHALEKAAQEKAAQEKAAQEKAAQEKAAQEKAAQEKAEREKAAEERAARDRAARAHFEQPGVAKARAARAAKRKEAAQRKASAATAAAEATVAAAAAQLEREAEMRRVALQERERAAAERIRLLQQEEQRLAEEGARQQQELEERLLREREEQEKRERLAEEARRAKEAQRRRAAEAEAHALQQRLAEEAAAQERLSALQQQEAAIEEELRRRQEEEAAALQAQEARLRAEFEEQQAQAEAARAADLALLRAQQEQEEEALRQRIADKQRQLAEARAAEERAREEESRRMLEALALQQAKDEQAAAAAAAAAAAEEAQLQDDAAVDHWLAQLTDEPSAKATAMAPAIDAQAVADAAAAAAAAAAGEGLELAAFEQEVHVLQQLGVGTFGSTHRGVLHGKQVAVKRLACNLYSSRDFVAQLHHEAEEAAAASPHPGLAAVVGVSTRGRLVLVAEYVEGTPLHGLLRNRGADFTQEERLRVARQVAEAVAHLHKCGVPARCLKPRNVVVAADGRAVLKDYGLVCVKDHVRAAGAAGTPQYEAPELLALGKAAAAGRLDEKAADAYAFGMLLWELYAGTSPFAGRMAREVRAAVLAGERPHEPLDCPVALHRVMAACWAAEPARRPPFAMLARLLAQPLSKLLQHGLTQGAAPAAAPMPTSPASGTPPAAAVPVGGEVAATPAVARRVVQLLASGDEQQQLKATAALDNVARTKANAAALLAAGVVPALAALLSSRPPPQTLARAAHATAILVGHKEVREAAALPLAAPLVALLGHGTDLVAVQAARASVALAADSRGQAALLSAAATPPLVALLARPGAACQTQAAWALAQLCEREEGREALVVAGGVRPLLQLLTNANAAVQLHALAALAALAASARLEVVLQRAQVLPRFLALLDSPSPALRRQAAAAAERLARQPRSRAQLVQGGGMAALVRMLQQPSDPALALVALEALQHFADAATLGTFVRAQGLAAVVACLSADDAAVRGRALAFLQAFVAAAPRNAEIARAVGAVPPLVALLTAPAEGAAAVRLAVTLARQPRCAEALATAGALPPLLARLAAPAPAPTEALAALAPLLVASRPARAALLASGAAEGLLAHANAATPGPTGALAAFAALACDGDAAPALVQAHRFPLALEQAAAALSAAPQSSLLAALAALSALPAAQDVVADRAAPALVRALGGEDPDRTVALKAVAQLCRNPAAHGSLVRANAIAALRGLEGDGRLGAVAGRVLQLLPQ